MITVIINTYNRQKDLKRCLNALLRQTLKADEILIVDNNSTDGTAELLKKYPVKVLSDPAKKLSYLFNLGWKNSRSKILAYIADDACPQKDWLENIIKTLQKYPKAAAVSGPVISTCFPAGEMHRLYLISRRNMLYKALAWPYLHFVLEDKVLLPGRLCQSGAYTIGAGLKQSKKYPEMEIDLLTTTSMGIRRASLRKIRGFDENFHFNHADGDLFVRLKRAGYQLIFNPKIIVWHHVRLGPSRNPYFIGRDSAYFLLKDVRPKTLSGWFGYLINICFLNFYWIYKAIASRQIRQLLGIVGFIRGIGDYLTSSRSTDNIKV